MPPATKSHDSSQQASKQANFQGLLDWTSSWVLHETMNWLIFSFSMKWTCCLDSPKTKPNTKLVSSHKERQTDNPTTTTTTTSRLQVWAALAAEEGKWFLNHHHHWFSWRNCLLASFFHQQLSSLQLKIARTLQIIIWWWSWRKY